ncbi:uncharacterized protein AB675_8898 [Cyphellophora attinorum]|uniref:Uncharacterized protein n=1 Tax=Cyphellophora attinorum TaxID=1664694 RepID=A0A0N1H4I7_9EURO|nr:uncharacterized protein AB675_8898 [Phialophora attinorum]KPI36205.1 hypothetical protein AB675_8898 [Phialophora attinorum]
MSQSRHDEDERGEDTSSETSQSDFEVDESESDGSDDRWPMPASIEDMDEVDEQLLRHFLESQPWHTPIRQHIKDMIEADKWLLRYYHEDPKIKAMADDMSKEDITALIQSMEGGESLDYTTGMARAHSLHITFKQRALKASQWKLVRQLRIDIKRQHALMLSIGIYQEDEDKWSMLSTRLHEETLRRNGEGEEVLQIPGESLRKMWAKQEKLDWPEVVGEDILKELDELKARRRQVNPQ